MGMLGLIGRDKPDCEWVLMTSRAYGKAGCTFYACLLTVKCLNLKPGKAFLFSHMAARIRLRPTATLTEAGQEHRDPLPPIDRYLGKIYICI